MELLRQDYRRYLATGHSKAGLVFSRGFHAVVSFRFRHWLCRKRIPVLHILIGFLTEVITGVEIPPTVVAGGGLVIYHGGPLVIVDSARLGDNIGLRPGVVIGGDYSGGGVPIIGSNTEVGVGAKIIGNLELGEGCQIGANAVVTKSFPAGSVLVGVPARLLARG